MKRAFLLFCGAQGFILTCIWIYVKDKSRSGQKLADKLGL